MFFMFIYITAGLAAYILSVLLHLLYILTFACAYFFLERYRVIPLHPHWFRHCVVVTWPTFEYHQTSNSALVGFTIGDYHWCTLICISSLVNAQNLLYWIKFQRTLKKKMKQSKHFIFGTKPQECSAALSTKTQEQLKQR